MDYRTKSEALKNSLDKIDRFQKLLYRRGYIVTTNGTIDTEIFPFYKNWEKYRINDSFFAYIHCDQHFYIEKNENSSIILIGHAYNPFTEQFDEREILNDALKKYSASVSDYLDYISELSGIHVIGIFDNNTIRFVQDCTGMEACNYGICNGNVYFVSESGLLGDIESVTENHFIKRLTHSYSYNHFGTKYLPGNLTVFDELSRLGPNLFLEFADGLFSIHRFYPSAPHHEVDETNKDVTNRIAEILRNSVSLCAQKWNRPAISLSGGLDSRTTLSAARNQYDSFVYYSFHCKEQEKEDAFAAKAICESIGISHKIYPISDRNDDFPDFELFKAIVAHNQSYIHIPPDHEIRKYYYLSCLDDFDIELKSWASEIGRAYWEKRYGFSLPERLSPRDFSLFQTRFIGAPFLLRQNDAAYREFLIQSGLEEPIYNYEHTDLFYWEYRFGSNGTCVTMEQQVFQFDVTMPMNNRKLMDMFLWYPHSFRKQDGVNKRVIETNEPRLANDENSVHNGYFSKRRMMLERMYYKASKLFDNHCHIK